MASSFPHTTSSKARSLVMSDWWLPVQVSASAMAPDALPMGIHANSLVRAIHAEASASTPESARSGHTCSPRFRSCAK
jgi:hypothetical protein